MLGARACSAGYNPGPWTRTRSSHPLRPADEISARRQGQIWRRHKKPGGQRPRGKEAKASSFQYCCRSASGRLQPVPSRSRAQVSAWLSDVPGACLTCHRRPARFGKAVDVGFVRHTVVDNLRLDTTPDQRMEAGTSGLVAKADALIERGRVLHLRSLPFGRLPPRS
jgi:hypothetical protein